MTFCDRAWQRITPLRNAIHHHSFNVELANGTLTQERFAAYIIQDSLYLAEYRRALLLAAGKAPEAYASETFANSAAGVLAVEAALHERTLAEFGVSPDDVRRRGAWPDCFAYTSFLLASAHQEPWEVLVAALLPCFWIYWDVGLAIAKRSAASNPFQAWIDTYADESFGQSVKRVIGITDQAAAATSEDRRHRMLAAFERSSQYEWLFWDGAYQGRSWPLTKEQSISHADAKPRALQPSEALK